MATKGGEARVKRLVKWMHDNEAYGLTYRLVREFLATEGEREVVAAVNDMAYVTRSDYPEITFQLLIAVCGELRDEKQFTSSIRSAWEDMTYKFGVSKGAIKEEDN